MSARNGGADPVRSNAADKTISSHQEAGQQDNTAPGEPGARITSGDGLTANVKADTNLPSEDDPGDAIRWLLLRAVCTTGGALQPGTAEWWEAPTTVQLASVAVLGQEYIPTGIRLKAPDPLTVADPLTIGARPSHTELQRRRDTPATPLRCGSPDKCTARGHRQPPPPSGSLPGALSVATRMIPTPPSFYVELRDDQPLGTGEGLAESFYGTAQVPDSVRLAWRRRSCSCSCGRGVAA